MCSEQKNKNGQTMLGIIYLFIMFLVGNLICRRFYDFMSLPHRLAGTFLVGFLVSTWATYLFALIFFWTQNPLLWGNLLFFVSTIIFFFLFYRRNQFEFSKKSLFQKHNTDKWDWFFISLFFAFSCWLMFGMFGLSEGVLKIDSIIWNDFGPNLSIAQSFAVGRNFPTEYPHFIGEPIRYHFMFWFQTGNLAFLGLDIDWSLNILSVLTMTAMLALLVVLGQTAFDSKAVGRIATTLFFFHGTLSYIPFLLKSDSPAEGFSNVLNLNEWLKSIYLYVGEQWGIWSLGTFLAQRHLPSSIGIFLVILIFLIKHIREKISVTENQQDATAQNQNEEPREIVEAENNRHFTPRTSFLFESSPIPNLKLSDRVFETFIFSGILLGLLPLWNSAVYVSAFAVIGGLLLVFPVRVYTFFLLAVSALVAVPQILFLRAGGSRNISELFQWGYVVDPPNLGNVLQYFSFTFGMKTLLALVAAAVLSAFHRRLFAASCVLLILAFGTKLSTDIMNNHKFLHIWVILINLFVASALWRLSQRAVAGKVVAVLLFVAITLGGLIELFRINNDTVVDVPLSGGAFYEWLYAETTPEDVFLTDKYIHHPILLSGRRIFYGWHYFGWSMNYPTKERDIVYKKLFEERNPAKLIWLLNRNNIKYVAIDDNLRQITFKDTLNEAVFEKYFQKVFTDSEKKNGSLIVYKVPPEDQANQILK